MAIQPMALGVANPQVNALQSFSQGQQAQQTARNNNLVNAREAMRNIGSLAFGVMGGKLDGQPDPQLWEQSLDMLSQQGMDVEAFRGRPDLAPVVAKASVDTLGQMNHDLNEQQLEQRIKEFGFQVMEAAKGPAPTTNQRDFMYAQQNPEYAEFLGKGEGGYDPYGFEAGSDKSQRVQAMVQNGVPPDVASGVVAGQMELRQNPETGAMSVFDWRTQTAKPISVDYGQAIADATGMQPAPDTPAGEGQSAPAQQQEGGDQAGGMTLWEQAPNATGMGVSVQQGAQSTIGQIPGAIGESVRNDENTDALADFELFRRNMIQSMALSPRFPIAEQKVIENMLSRGAFTDVSKLQSQLRAFDRELDRIIDVAEQELADPRTALDKQADLRTQIENARQAKRRIGIPEEGQAAPAQSGDNTDPLGIRN